MQRTILLLSLIAALGCVSPTPADDGRPATEPPDEGLARATFAGGCFWCMEPPFDKVDGVISTTSGFIGGAEIRPTYKEVAYGKTSHTEAVEIVYDPEKVSYEELLHIFWRNIDPTVADRQFCDIGPHYRTGIFAHGEEQRRLAEASKAALVESSPFGGPILTEIADAGPFYPAERYHQNFYKKNPVRYHSYRKGCGRDARLRQLWGDEAGGH
ncbi:MAG: peptide-methionine (S)-S-oxide reductase MsrA [Acidobacteriota bacterium]